MDLSLPGNTKIYLAQAGSGKTTTLISELEKESRDLLSSQVAFVTFTRRGVQEGKERFCKLMGYKDNELPYFSTLHSLTFRAMGYKRTSIFSSYQETRFNKAYGYAVNRSISSVVSGVMPTRDTMYLNYYDMERSNALDPIGELDYDIDGAYYARLVHDYEEFKENFSLVDFFDCLINYVREGSPLLVKVVAIDEAQDLTLLQWKVIEKAFGRAERMLIAGDENQSIYSYAGARPDYLIRLSKQYPVSYLAVSHRIPLSVYCLAKGLTEFINDKTDKPFVFDEDNGKGSVNRVADVDELMPYIRRSGDTTWYILCRVNSRLSGIRQLLENECILYSTADGFVIPDEDMMKIRDYLNFDKAGYKTKKQKEAFEMKYEITEYGLPLYMTALFPESKAVLYQSYIDVWGFDELYLQSKLPPKITVSSIHCVKGGEADNVAIILDTTSKIEKNIYKSLDEELRILYVAVTRARNNLYLVNSAKGDGYEKIIDTVMGGEQWNMQLR